MSEIEGLKTRVEQAVDQLSSVQNARQDQNQNLATLLGNLEEKFSARTAELDYCNTRIEALTVDNAHLSEFLERLINMIESDPVTAEDDPLIRASTMAASLLEGWSGGETPVEEASVSPEAPEVEETSQGQETQELISEDSVSLAFDDVSDEELEAENLMVLDGDVSELVASAIAAAQGLDGDSGNESETVGDDVSLDRVAAMEEDVQDELDQPEIVLPEIVEEIVEDDIMDEPVAADIEIPETEFASEDNSDDDFSVEIEEDTEASIRSMMARLEAAALEAKFATADDAGEASASEGSEQVA